MVIDVSFPFIIGFMLFLKSCYPINDPQIFYNKVKYGFFWIIGCLDELKTSIIKRSFFNYFVNAHLSCRETQSLNQNNLIDNRRSTV